MALRVKDVRGQSREQQQAKIGMSSVVVNAATSQEFASRIVGDIDLAECAAVMVEKVRKVQSGDLSELEAILTAQAISFDLIFNALARRAASNIGEYMNAVETYLRVALKAQAQCRATLETLAEIKNPTPSSFVKQANVAIGGPQQVNVGQATHAGMPSAPAGPARAEDPQTEANRLLEGTGGARVDAGPPSAAGAADSLLETVAVIDWAAH